MLRRDPATSHACLHRCPDDRRLGGRIRDDLARQALRPTSGAAHFRTGPSPRGTPRWLAGLDARPAALSAQNRKTFLSRGLRCCCDCTRRPRTFTGCTVACALTDRPHGRYASVRHERAIAEKRAVHRPADVPFRVRCDFRLHFRRNDCLVGFGATFVRTNDRMPMRCGSRCCRRGSQGGSTE
jgi:hypothetical protein